ncbi:MAG: fructose-bisphosphatase class III [Candidatus Margulisiibacteriota bacterium]
MATTIVQRPVTIPRDVHKRVVQLFNNKHRRVAGKDVLPLPKDLGKPLALITSDAHGEVRRFLDAFEHLPLNQIPLHIDLGDKLDRGPEPEAMNFLLASLGVQRLIGNHDAMWLAAGLGIPRIAIEQIRWLMRYGEEEFLESAMGIELSPLEEYAGKYFADHRINCKSKRPMPMEAAATYLKIIAEAPYRFPEHQNTVLNDSDLRIRKALFHKDAYDELKPGERDTFDRLTAEATLNERDKEYFYRLMGGLRDLNEEGAAIVDHFVRAFRDNHAYLQLVLNMVGRGDIYGTLRMSQGAPADMLFTHAGVLINEEGHLAEYNGLTGRESFRAIEDDIRGALFAWEHHLLTGDRSFLDAMAPEIDMIGDLAWGANSPLFMRDMQTAARAVLTKASGTYAEPERAYYTKFVGSEDLAFVGHVCNEIGRSFGFDPRRLLIVHGHKPNKKGHFVTSSFDRDGIGHDLNIDAGLADAYGAHGGFLLIGTQNLYRFSADKHEFIKVSVTSS